MLRQTPAFRSPRVIYLLISHGQDPVGIRQREKRTETHSPAFIGSPHEIVFLEVLKNSVTRSFAIFSRDGIAELSVVVVDHCIQ